MPGPNEAIVHLYRPIQQGINNPPIEFFLDEKMVARLEPDRFTTVRVAPGRRRVMGRAILTFTEYWLPPAEFEALSGRSYFVYPIAITRKEDWSGWKPLALAAGVAVLSRGAYFLVPGASANVAVGHYWQLADDSTLDANVDRMKRAEFIGARQQQ